LVTAGYYPDPNLPGTKKKISQRNATANTPPSAVEQCLRLCNAISRDTRWRHAWLGAADEVQPSGVGPHLQELKDAGPELEGSTAAPVA